MRLTSTDLDRWQRRSPPPKLRTTRLRPPAGKPADTAPELARRLRFLTADGQTATALEQEALLGTNDLVEASFLDRLDLVTGCVGRLRCISPRGRTYATGFLIAPGLVMTNHHVFPDAQAAAGAAIEFGYRYDIAGQLPPTAEFDLRPAEFFVADQELDFAVVAIAAESTIATSLDERGYLRLNPESGKVGEHDFVTIVQHPDGAPLQIALRENEVVRASQDEPVIWYQADTAHGSSGAPVFNDSFQIAALHSSGRIKRNQAGHYALRRGGWAKSLDGLTESDVIWEANVGVRISRICASLLPLAKAASAAHCRTLEAAMNGNDVIARAIAGAKSGIGDDERKELEDVMPNGIGGKTMRTMSGSRLAIPLELRISLEIGGSVGNGGLGAIALAPGDANGADSLEVEAFKMKVPVIYDGLKTRGGFNRKFLDLAGSKMAPMPKLTKAGKKIAAPLLDGSGIELKYHKFSVWMHKERRIALFTASNVDWRARKKSIGGKKLDRETLAGFPPKSKFAEQWVSDSRLAPAHQLPDIFYTEDRQAFDKGHLVRRDDVCWGTSFEDIQKGNGDTYHVTNCSPQIKPFNQGAHGEENWGDLESHIQDATKKDLEKVVIYAGPVLRDDDRVFRGLDDDGATRVRIPSRYWKIVVTKGKKGPEAYGFVLAQDVTPITEKEFYVTDEWKGTMRPIAEIEKDLNGWMSLADLKPYDQYDRVQNG